jgi:2-iminoacetate synthase
LRLAVPYAGLILTAREPAELRGDVIRLGVTQIDAGTRLEIGGYQEKRAPAGASGGADGDGGGGQDLSRAQFRVGDTRTLDAVAGWLAAEGMVPSFCTSCYRRGRTGEKFMSLAGPGAIKNFCQPNALVTFAEYLEDYAGEDTRREGQALIERETATLPEKERTRVEAMLARVRAGERDIAL